MRNNKTTGTAFEKEFAIILSQNGFWVHLFQDNKNGQPCDVIAARDGDTYLFDCKDCQGTVFAINRMEENQYNAMKLFRTTGNRRGMFVIRFSGNKIRLIDFQVLKDLKDGGAKQIKREEVNLYGRSLQGWMDDLDVFREMSKVEYIDANTD